MVARFGASELELHSVVALVVYLLFGWLLTKLLWMLVGESRSGVAASSQSVRQRVGDREPPITQLAHRWS